MKIFMDMEFTNLHQRTTPISLGLVSEAGDTFYAEFTDFDRDQVNDWLERNVLAHLLFNKEKPIALSRKAGIQVYVAGERGYVRREVERWTARWQEVEMWGDCLAYDWVLFCEMFGGAQNLPSNIYYIPFDLATLMKVKGVDPDISRTLYAGDIGFRPHNAFDDAVVIAACYRKLMEGEGYVPTADASVPSRA